MRNLDLTISLTSMALAAALIAVLGWRRTYRQYPLFFVYVVSSLLIAILRFSVRGDYRLFFKVYWSTEAIYALVALLALYEVFRRVFQSFFPMYRWFWVLFPAVVAIVGAIATLHALQHPPVQAIPIIGVILSVGIGVNVIQSGIFVLFFATVSFFKVRRKNYPLRIVDGFALIALSGLVFELRSIFGTGLNTLVKYAPPVAYLVAILLWLYTFIQPPEPDPKWELEISPQQLLDDIRRYTIVLRKFRGGKR